MRKYMSWDIETHKILPEDVKDIMAHRPLGITCASVLVSGEEHPRLFCSGGTEIPLPRKMNYQELMIMAKYMYGLYKDGCTPLAWNGNFDFQILIEELNGRYKEELLEMARNSVDPMFQILCVKGYPLGLETAAMGMGVGSKAAGIHGDQAPALWQQSEADRHAVLEYVAGDAILPLNLVSAIEKSGLLRWISKSGREQVMRMDHLMTVAEARKLPLPNTSWMSTPFCRDDFYGWAFSLQDAAIKIADTLALPADTVYDVLAAYEAL